jgi:molecular chaperone GrpE (heat shock protein)
MAAEKLSDELPDKLDVPLDSLVELAIESWRLEHWLAGLPPEKAASKLRHIARRLQKFLTERELAALDLTGQKYEPGMAVEVLEVVPDEHARAGEKLIVEMVAPIITWRGRVVRHGQIVVGQRSL